MLMSPVVLVLPYMSVVAHMRVAINTTKLQLSRAVGVGHVDERLSSSMSMCTIQLCAKLNHTINMLLNLSQAPSGIPRLYLMH